MLLNVLPIDILSNCLNNQEGTQNCNVIVMAWETAHLHGLSFPIHDFLQNIWNNFEYIQEIVLIMSSVHSSMDN